MKNRIMSALCAHGAIRGVPKKNRVTGTKSDDPFKKSFRVVLRGENLRSLKMSGALGIEQLKKLPGLIAGRRANGTMLQHKLGNHPLFTIQHEIGESSWFGFSLVLRREVGFDRKDMVRRLTDKGFECRPIVAGNFAKNEVLKYFDHKIYGSLAHAAYIDSDGLFVGNHHYPIPDAINALAEI